MRLLLGSGGLSTPERREVWKKEFDNFMGPKSRVTFLPFAVGDYEACIKRVTELDLVAGRKLESLHTAKNPREAILEAEAIYIFGGNSFRLLAELYRLNLIEVIQERVRAGVPYIGTSAGTNMACPTLKTTNDMPIIYPPSFNALGLVPFQINPHYFAGAIHYEAPEGLIRYGGETRDDRLREFHEMNDTPVVGICEGTAIRVEGKSASLCGPLFCRIFRKGKPPEDRPPGSDLSDLL